ncbi:MAG: hypothetical protein Q7S64_03380 [bacterium]|nr:hypothetical protein [bacterium]
MTDETASVYCYVSDAHCMVIFKVGNDLYDYRGNQLKWPDWNEIQEKGPPRQINPPTHLLDNLQKRLHFADLNLVPVTV